MTSLWTLPTPEPIRQSVVRWACRFFLCLPECCCPFRLQLHFNFKQLIVVAMPRGPVEKTFTAFLLILRPNNHGTIGRTLLPTTTGHCSSMNQMLPPFFLLYRQWEPKQSQHEPPKQRQHVLWLFIWDGREKRFRVWTCLSKACFDNRFISSNFFCFYYLSWAVCLCYQNGRTERGER